MDTWTDITNLITGFFLEIFVWQIFYLDTQWRVIHTLLLLVEAQAFLLVGAGSAGAEKENSILLLVTCLLLSS